MIVIVITICVGTKELKVGDHYRGRKKDMAVESSIMHYNVNL